MCLQNNKNKKNSTICNVNLKTNALSQIRVKTENKWRYISELSLKYLFV